MVEIAHFDPVQLTVVIEGVYPGVTLGLPRVRDPRFSAALSEARDRWVEQASECSCVERNLSAGLKSMTQASQEYVGTYHGLLFPIWSCPLVLDPLPIAPNIPQAFT